MADRDFDVVVVGAGPAGLAAACRAAECGRRVAMLDDNPAARRADLAWRVEGSAELDAARGAARRGVDRGRARLRRARSRKRLAVEIFDGRVPHRVPQPDSGHRRARALPAVPRLDAAQRDGRGRIAGAGEGRALPVAGKRVVIAGQRSAAAGGGALYEGAWR